MAADIMKRVVSAAKILLMNVLLLAAVLYGFEIALVLRSPEDEAPGDGRTATWGKPVRSNAYGFRGPEVAEPKPPGTIRVLVLGDSLTWGVGLEEKERYTERAESCLRDRYPERGFEVVNFGRSGASTVQERKILEKYGDLLRPDLVVVGFCLNDTQPRGQDYSVEKERFVGRCGETLVAMDIAFAVAGLERTGLLVRRGLFRFLELTGVLPSWEESLDRTYDPGSPEWRDFESALTGIREISDGMNLPPPLFTVLNQGASKGPAEDYGTSKYYRRWYQRWFRQAGAAAARLGFAVIDHEGEIARDLRGESLVINERDGHPSAALNGVYADKLCDAITGLVESGRLSPR